MLVCVGLAAATASRAAPCPQQPPAPNEACVTGFDLSRRGPAVDYLLPLPCQYNLTREVIVALQARGHVFSAADLMNDYQLKRPQIVALRCQRISMGLAAAPLLDRKALNLLLGRDILAERCKRAGYDARTCPILKPGAGQ